MLETYFKPGEITIDDLAGDFQTYKMHHFLPRKIQLAIKKGNNITLKLTKGIGSSRNVNKVGIAMTILSQRKRKWLFFLIFLLGSIGIRRILMVDLEETTQLGKARGIERKRTLKMNSTDSLVENMLAI